jgi:hypothetical protein
MRSITTLVSARKEKLEWSFVEVKTNQLFVRKLYSKGG